jgi:hypothetical protein
MYLALRKMQKVDGISYHSVIDNTTSPSRCFKTAASLGTLCFLNIFFLHVVSLQISTFHLSR